MAELSPTTTSLLLDHVAILPAPKLQDPHDRIWFYVRTPCRSVTESDYVKRVEQLSLLNRSLNRVLQYINHPPTHDVLDHAQLCAVLVGYASQGPRSSVMRAFEGAGASLEQLRQLRCRPVRQPSYKTYSLILCIPRCAC